MPRESFIVEQCIKRLRQLDGCCVRKRHGSVYTVAGDPDLSGCIHGRHFELEVKQPGGYATVLQSQRLREWERAGATVAVVTSADEAVRVVLGIVNGV